MAKIDYPEGFPVDLKPAITAADAKARRTFRKAAEDLRRAPGYDHDNLKLKALFKKWAFSTSAVAAHQLRIAVKLGRRHAHLAQSDLEELLEDCIWRANLDAHRFRGKDLSDDEQDELQQDMETSDEWIELIDAIAEARRKPEDDYKGGFMRQELELDRAPSDIIKSTPAATLSSRETTVHNIIGEQNFRQLTNAEILKDRGLKRRLNTDFQFKAGDAAKSCLDRIRKAKGYPLSRTITKKRSTIA